MSYLLNVELTSSPPLPPCVQCVGTQDSVTSEILPPPRHCCTPTLSAVLYDVRCITYAYYGSDFQCKCEGGINAMTTTTNS